MPSPTQHISKQFDADIEKIRSRVLQMGGLVEAQLLDAMEGLLSADKALLQKVREGDKKVNAMEVQIDDDCQHVIALRQPAASDLRLVLTVIKIINDLERIGDETKKVAKMSLHIFEADRINFPRFNDIKHMADMALDMLRRALDAFARMDLSATAQIVKQDQLVDEEFRSVMRQLITFMMEDPRTISTSLDILFMAKAIERIGDHAKNISEYVVYLVKGKDIRHSGLEALERITSADSSH